MGWQGQFELYSGILPPEQVTPLKYRSSSCNSGKHRMAASAEKRLLFCRAPREAIFFPASSSKLYHNHGFGFPSNRLSLQCAFLSAELATPLAALRVFIPAARCSLLLRRRVQPGRQNAKEWAFFLCAGTPQIWFLSLAGTCFNAVFKAFLYLFPPCSARSLILSLPE